MVHHDKYQNLFSVLVEVNTIEIASAQGLIITNNPDDEFEASAILDRIKEGSIEEQKIHDGSLDVWLIIW